MPQPKFDYKLLFGKTPEEIVAFLKSKKIAVTWNWREQIKLIEENVFTVAKVLNADVLQDIQDSLTKNLADGGSYEQFKKDIVPTLEQKGYLTKSDGSAWNLDLIYRQNLQGAYNAGRLNQQLEIKDKFPYLKFIAVVDERTTKNICLPLNGKVFRVDDALDIYPPNHFRCRSRVSSLSEGQLSRRVLKVSKVTPSDKSSVAEGFLKPPTAKFIPKTDKYSPAIKKQIDKDLK